MSPIGTFQTRRSVPLLFDEKRTSQYAAVVVPSLTHAAKQERQRIQLADSRKATYQFREGNAPSRKRCR
jgi:hypothetical protein